ncbi:hypothetical protein R1521_07760 [Rhizobium brockwellii]|uniref:Uncharacterized protein n=1 Tax=Rhizobium brockwellii TaxID=3019932 RepID=A0ABU3YIG2_9HYPH|nr:hypothetical protein [Rhizobium brockwellii]MDV4178398.1 hypothetical protein [Rhizobium brockwellii]MDV4185397.1 hypothetical protein [Rhizobium brockwellii]
MGIGKTAASAGLPDLSAFDDVSLLRLRAQLHSEMKRRGLALSVGQVAEKLAIAFFNSNPGCTNLSEAAVNTANVDALSRRGDRYSIKGVLDAKKLERYTRMQLTVTGSFSNTC